jgi:hypothetical protein
VRGVQATRALFLPRAPCSYHVRLVLTTCALFSPRAPCSYRSSCLLCTRVTLAWVDVDADGDLDIIEGNSGQPNSLWINQGDLGGWLYSMSYVGSLSDAGSTDTTIVRVADLNGDGNIDVAVANRGAVDEIHLNNVSLDAPCKLLVCV